MYIYAYIFVHACGFSVASKATKFIYTEVRLQIYPSVLPYASLLSTNIVHLSISIVQTKEIDNRGTGYYLSMYWAQNMVVRM